MARYRKKPVEVDAFQWVPSAPVSTLPSWFMTALTRREVWPEFDGTCTICTLEDGADGRAKHVASPGDWIICGVKGELYPCKPDIFEMTYEKAE